MEPETLPHPEHPRLLHALGWNTLGGLLSAGSAFVLGIVLGRILGPRPFGLVAAAMLPISLGQLLIDQGMSAELIQKPTLDSRDLRQARKRQIVVGSVLSATLALSSSLLAHWYHIPALKSVVLWLSPLFFFQALSQVPLALLKRHLCFQRLQTIQVGSYLFGYLGFGIPMAFSGFGVWSLVVAQSAQVILQTLVLILLSPRAHDHFGDESIDSATFTQAEHAFAWRVMATNLANWTQSNLVGVIIGRNFGSLELGLFNRAQNLVQTPLSVLTNSLQGVLFPAAAAAQNDIPKLRATFLKANRTLAWVAFPVAGLGISWAHPIVEGIYGPAWAAAAPLLTPLFVALPFVALMSITGPVLLGLGIASAEFKIQVVLGLVTLATLVGIAGYGVLWMAWAIAIIQAMRWAWMTSAITPRIALSVDALTSCLVIPILAGVLAAFGGWALEWALRSLALGLSSRLLAEVGFVSIGAILAFTFRYHASLRNMMAVSSKPGVGKR